MIDEMQFLHEGDPEYQFPYLSVGKQWSKVVGARRKRLRIYECEGTRDGKEWYEGVDEEGKPTPVIRPCLSLDDWLDGLYELTKGDLIPSKLVAGYVGVSRAAVRRKVLAGKLTQFNFSLVVWPDRIWREASQEWEFPAKTITETYSFNVRSECREWRWAVNRRREYEEEMWGPPPAEFNDCDDD